MGIIGIKIKLMPTSPEVDLEEIKVKAQELVEQKGGKNREYEIEPIAFGLKAIIAFFNWPEEKDSEGLEETLSQIENVNSAQLIDMRKIA